MGVLLSCQLRCGFPFQIEIKWICSGFKESESTLLLPLGSHEVKWSFTGLEQKLNLIMTFNFRGYLHNKGD